MSTTPKLDEFLDAEGKSMLGDALAEIREHLQRIPVPQATSAYIGQLWAQEHIDKLMSKPETEPTRYPSEAETRLIELCELMQFELACHLSSKCDKFADELATIKRDLGLV